MQFNLMRAVCSSLLWRGMLLGKSPRDLQAESWSIQAGDFGLTALLRSGGKYICAPCWVDAHSQCSRRNAFQRIICPGKLSSRALVRSASLVCLIVLSTCNARRGFAQFGIPGLGGKSGQSNDQKANQLLHQHLPLVLDANNAYPTVPDQNMLGGPFHPRTLPITLDTLTKPLPPGDYVLPMTFFCSEYSVHRGGNGIAYQLGPAQGTAAKAISTLLWRGMLTGHKPQDLQSVSWAIQGSIAYDKMPPKYRALVDQLIPEMKNQVNGQAFADIEDGFQGKVNKVTKKISEGIGKGTGGFVHADIKVDVELNQSFQRLGQVGRSALDGEKLNTIFTTAFPSDEARDQALYAGQGQQSAALPATNGPWSVKVPGVAYMRFMVHGGNLQGDNVMQIRILPPRTSQAQLDERPHLVLAGYEQSQQSTSSGPSVVSLFNGSVNEAALSQCQATPVNQQVCSAQAISINGEMCYSIGTGAQACIATPTQPIMWTPPQPSSTPVNVCVKKVVYRPVYRPSSHSYGLCIFLAAVSSTNNSCVGETVATVPAGQNLNWVQTYRTNYDPKNLDPDPDKNDGAPRCTPGKAWKDPCSDNQKLFGPLYRPDEDKSPGGNNSIFEEGGPEFPQWKASLANLGDLQLIFRDIPSRQKPDNLRVVDWSTWPDRQPKNELDNNLRLVSYTKGDEEAYTPLIQIKYGFRIDFARQLVNLDPLFINGVPEGTGGSRTFSQILGDTTIPQACIQTDENSLGEPPG